MNEDVELEEQITKAAGKVLKNALDKLLQWLTAEYVKLFGDLDAVPTAGGVVGLENQLAARLNTLPKAPSRSKILGLLDAAHRYGAEQAAAHLGIPLSEQRHVPDQLSLEVTRDVRAMQSRVQKHQRAARVLLAASGIDSYPDAVRVVAVAHQSLTTVERSVRWQANRAIADGTQKVINDEGTPRVWVPERNACLHCLAYAGKVAAVGEDFPGGLTYGDQPLGTDPVKNPPLHPNCRCRIQPWFGDHRPDPDVQVTDALQREAERTVLRGWADGSEPARLRAAERLLLSGVKAPKSVKKAAEDAIKRGGWK